VRSDVYRFCSIKDIWIIEFRFDYPQGCDPSNDVKAFMRAFDVTLRDARPDDNACQQSVISRCKG